MSDVGKSQEKSKTNKKKEQEVSARLGEGGGAVYYFQKRVRGGLDEETKR